jgi:hypothetical protein
MIDRANPVSVETLGQIPGHAEDIKKLHQQIIDAAGAREAWVSKQEKLLRQRKGVRKPKVFPWPGSNNHSWPLTDAIIRRWKPGMVSLVLGSDPVAYFHAQNPEAVRKAPTAQAYYHWRFTHMRGTRETAMELADYIAQHGTAYTRQGWEYRTRKTCRILNAQKLFPGGVEANHQQYLQQVQAAGQQIAQAVEAGQAPPEAMQQVPPQLDLVAFVTKKIEDEYLVSGKEPLERPQIEKATQALIQGAQQVRLYYQIVTDDRPAWKAISPLDTIVPPRMDCMEDSPFIALQHRLTGDDLLKLAVDGHIDMSAALKVAQSVAKKAESEQTQGSWERHSYYSGLTSVKDAADGVDQQSTTVDEGATVVWEVYAKLDVDGDGLKEKVVLWYHHSTKTVLALYPYPYPFEEWPIVRFQFEHLSNRPYESRGIAELASVFQANVNKLHNARLDAVQITLSPMFQMRTQAGEVNRNIKFMPGAIIPVQNMGDIAPLPVDTKPVIQLMQEENYTKGLAEQYIGIFDPSVMAQNSVERRTATEVEAVMQQTQAVFGQDAALFQDAMGKVHKQLWKLCMEFDKDEIYYRVTGDEVLYNVKKHEIDDEYDIVPAGTPANTSKQLAMARSRESIQLFLQDQTGLIDKWELYKNYFDILDPNMGKLILRSKEEAAAIQQVMQAMNSMADQQGVPPNARPTTP